MEARSRADRVGVLGKGQLELVSAGMRDGREEGAGGCGWVGRAPAWVLPQQSFSGWGFVLGCIPRSWPVLGHTVGHFG